MAEPGLVQAWDLTVDGAAHRVEVRGGVRRHVTWTVDGALVGQKTSMDDRIVVRAGDGLDGPDDSSRRDRGAVGVRFTGLGAPRRATLFPAGEEIDIKAMTGVGGRDLAPEPGSKAAVHEDRVRAHPTRYTLLQTAGGVAAVVVPILLATLLARWTFSLDLPDIPWPDLPSLPSPDLPSIPWPDVSIPWPDWSVPGWVERAAGYLKFVWPVVLAFVLARAEIRRRRQQDEARRADEARSDEGS